MDQPPWNDYLKQFESLGAHMFQNIVEKSNKYCVIVEFRKHPQLDLVIKNFMFLLAPHGWGLIVFHGQENGEYARNCLQGWKHVHYRQLPFDNVDQNGYSNILCGEEFWTSLLKIGCEHALIFQTDTVLLRPDIDKYLRFDYVGAPWTTRWMGILDFGNGGLSLRKVRTMLDIIKFHPRYSEWYKKLIIPELLNEDVYFSFWLYQDQHINPKLCLPSMEEAREFAVETLYHLNPCGMHRPNLSAFPSYGDFEMLLSKRWVYNRNDLPR